MEPVAVSQKWPGLVRNNTHILSDFVCRHVGRGAANFLKLDDRIKNFTVP